MTSCCQPLSPLAALQNAQSLHATTRLAVTVGGYGEMPLSGASASVVTGLPTLPHILVLAMVLS